MPLPFPLPPLDIPLSPCVIIPADFAVWRELL
jgi:hypothetical protein